MSSHVSWLHQLLLAAFSDFFQDPATFMLILTNCLLMLIGTVSKKLSFSYCKYSLSYLAHSAQLRTRLYILLALISFVFRFFFFSFLMISRKTVISGSAGPIFAIFSPNESIFGADDRSGPLFQYLKGRCHGNQFCRKIGKLPTFVAVAFRNRMGYHYLNVHINSVNDSSISCKIFINFGTVTPELTELICERLVRHGHLAE